MDPFKNDKGKAVIGVEEEKKKEEERKEISRSSSSSIGINSDEGKMGNEEEDDGSEIQSSSALDVSSLEDALPMKKSLSTNYVGRTKSFINLAEACGLDSAKDIAKAGDVYTRKRSNEVARNIIIGQKSMKTSGGGGIRTGGEMSPFETPSALSVSAGASSPHGNSQNLASSASGLLHPAPLADLHGIAAADERNTRLDNSSMDLQSATAADDSDNNRRLNNSATADLQSASPDDDSDRNRRLTNSSTSSDKGMDGSPKEPQK